MLNLKPGLPLEIYIYIDIQVNTFLKYSKAIQIPLSKQIITSHTLIEGWLPSQKKVKVSVTVDLDEIWGCKRWIKNFPG